LLQELLAGIKAKALSSEKENPLIPKLKSSFFEFLKYFWDTIIQEQPIYNWHIKYLCDEVQQAVERVIRREPKQYDLIINIPPGSTKSTICSQMLMAWAWTRDPGLRFICGSYSGDLALEQADYARDIVQSDKYRQLFPHVAIDPNKNNKSNYKTTVGGQRFSTSVGGSVTGVHAHVIVIDDPLNPKKAVSEVEVKNANQWIDRTLSTRKVDKAITLTILIMQRLSEDDCTGHWLRKAEKDGKRIKHICLPCDDSWEIKPAELKKYYDQNGGLLDPVRLTRDILREARVDLGSYGYAGQFGQSPAPTEGGIFKKRWFRRYSTLPERFERIIQSWDTAFKVGEENDYTVCQTWGEALNGYYLLDCWKRKVEFPELEYNIKRFYEEWRPLAVLVEDKASGQSVIQVVRRDTKIPIIPIPVNRDGKIIRARVVSPVVEAGKVYLPEEASWLEDFLDEVTRFPNSRKKDQVDAMTQFLAWVQTNSVTAGRDMS